MITHPSNLYVYAYLFVIDMLLHMREYSFLPQPEEKVRIPIPETGMHINAILRGDWSMPVVILVHGLACDNHGLLPFLMARTLWENGFSSLRVNLYDNEEDTRDMIDCTMDIHAQDFDTIVEYVRSKKAPAILAVGHSYGGLTILSGNAALDAAVLLEPSHFKCSFEYDLERRKGRHHLMEEEQMVVYEGGSGVIDPLRMVEERKNKMDTLEVELAAKPYPIHFIAAGDCPLVPYIKKYFTAANSPKRLTVIPGASHALTDSDEIMLTVFSETLQWLTRYAK